MGQTDGRTDDARPKSITFIAIRGRRNITRIRIIGVGCGALGFNVSEIGIRQVSITRSRQLRTCGKWDVCVDRISWLPPDGDGIHYVSSMKNKDSFMH